MQHNSPNEQEQFPHFYAHLQHTTNRRPTGTNRALSAAAKHSTTSSARTRSAGGQLSLHGTAQHHPQQPCLSSSSHPHHPLRHSCSSGANNNRPGSASSQLQAIRINKRRPASAAPSLLVTAQRVPGSSAAAAAAAACAASAARPHIAARPFSAAPASTHSHSQQQQHVQQRRPGSAAATAQHHPSQQQPAYRSGYTAPVWLCAQAAAAAAQTAVPVTTGARPASAHVRGGGNSSSSSSLGPADCSPTQSSRPASPLSHAVSRLSRPTSPSQVRPGSRAAAGVGGSSNNSGSSSSPWAAFGRDAPVVWQRASAAEAVWYAQQQQLQQQQQVDVRPPSPSHAADTPDECNEQLQGDMAPMPQPPQQQQQQQQLQQACCHHHQVAVQLFRSLPLSGAAAHASVTRESLQQMTLGLQLELQRVGAPLDLCLPSELDADGVRGASSCSSGREQPACGQERVSGATDVIEQWRASKQVAPELQLWQQLSAEMCRQVHLECSERGQLLQAAVDRQQSLLHQALACCDRLYEVLLLSAASHQQEHEDMLTAQHEAQVLQQDNNRLKALLDSKQAKLVSTSVELEQHQERMRRGRFHLIHEQVQEARMEIERRMLRDMEAQVHRATAAAEEAAGARQAVLLSAVEQLAGQEVAAAVLQQLEKHEKAAALQDAGAAVAAGQQEQQQQEENEAQQQQLEEEVSVAAALDGTGGGGDS